MSNIKYRKDIDGLRALAVIAVILYHLDISWIRAGFLGVDIFFVISGFLITSIIIRDLNNNCFSIKNFYLRRIKRILPALLIVLITTTFFAWLILLPEDLYSYAQSLVSAIASFSNIFFFATLKFGYFSSDSTIIPLLHTWSLGIEEQFYIFWPIILIVAFKFNIKSNKQIFIISSILLISSLIAFLSIKNQIFYYFPFTRAFELLFGCSLAILMNSSNIRSEPEKKSLFLNILALTLLIIPLFADVHYASLWPAIICLGTTLFIYLGNSSQPSPIHKVFSYKIFVYTGLISYSLYLWHWPIIAFINYLSIEKTILVDIIIIFLTFILATLTYHFIEKPFRQKKYSFNKALSFLFIIPLIIACILLFIISKYPKIGYNYAISGYYTVRQAVTSYGYIGDYNFNITNCRNSNPNSININKTEISNCIKNKKHFDVVLFGDSHAAAFTPMVSSWTKPLNLSTVSFGESQDKIQDLIYKKDIEQSIQNIIDLTHPKIFIFAGWWSSYTKNTTDTIKYLNKAVKKVTENNIPTLIILDSAPIFDKKPNCGMTRITSLLNQECFNNLDLVKKDQKESIKEINNIAQKNSLVKTIDINKIICDDKKCYLSIDNKILYSDNAKMTWGIYNSHLTNYGSMLVGKLYMEKYGNPLN
ncbi:acyltransferase family protein [Pseudofrancisella aestuarii]|uniref:Acyltransferase family protein n=1 Tax=Pseudofrancisella aestuarii TaxID=2670347 RepID=A0ABV9TAH3_9GAMM|nr:acyltransferase family protein [Pseudofrancisella aestuarii]